MLGLMVLVFYATGPCASADAPAAILPAAAAAAAAVGCAVCRAVGFGSLEKTEETRRIYNR